MIWTQMGICAALVTLAKVLQTLWLKRKFDKLTRQEDFNG